MKNSIGILFLLLGLNACSEPSKDTQLTIKKDHADQTQPVSGLTFEGMPNQQTTYETLTTNSIDENEALLLALQTELLKAKFDFIEKDSGTSWSENDCALNKIIQVKGEGIRSYTAVNQEKIGDDKKYRPDFVVLVFNFENEVIAEQNYQKIASAVYSAGGFCNGKSPETIVRNGREVFYFTTRAEMFRSYIDEYSALVKNYKSLINHEN